MVAIDNFVSISITQTSATLSRQGFGQPLLLSHHTRFAERYRTYSSLSEMTADGFVSSDAAFKMAQAVFDQDPTVPTVVIGRLPAAPSFTTLLTMTSAVEGQHVRFKIVQPATGTVSQIDYTIGAAETTTTVATAVELLTEAVAGVDSVASTATVTLTPTVAGAPVIVYDLENVTAKETTADAGYDDELSALELEYDGWYFIAIDSMSQANVEAVADWVLSRKKQFFFQTNASDEAAGTGTLGSGLEADANPRVVGIWAANPNEFIQARWIGAGAPKDPGTITWAYKTLLGATPATLTTTQRNNLQNNGINTYEAVSAYAGAPQSLNVTFPGKVASGLFFIDEIHGADALEADIKESVFILLAQADKVPFTNSGLVMVENAILGAMKRFEGSVEAPGFLETGSSIVIMPTLASLNPTDKANRILRGVRFKAKKTGAIHQVFITGQLTNA